LEVPRYITGVIRLQRIEATGENFPIFSVEAFEKLLISLIVCELLQIVEGGAHLDKAAIVEHNIVLIFHARHCRDIDEVF
jgi:hypothetical protein